jgi:CRP-like cAMP-binding protein
MGLWAVSGDRREDWATMDATDAGVEKTSGTDDPFAAFSPAIAEAWQASFMASFPSHIVRALLANARETQVEAGRVFYRGAYHDQMAMLGLVADGLLRIYLLADNGRQVTLHYAERGSIVGAPALLLGGTQNDSEQARQGWQLLGGRRIHGEALRDTNLLRLSPGQFLRLVRTEVSVAWPLATFLARRTVAAQQTLSDDMFLPVQARVARHLIDLASLQDDVLVVTAGHQEIADAIGSVREVVSRALGEMRDEGLITRRGNQTILTDVARLRGWGRQAARSS